LLLQSKAFQKDISKVASKIFSVLQQTGWRFEPLSIHLTKNNQLQPHHFISTTVHQLLSVQEIFDCFCKANHSKKTLKYLASSSRLDGGLNPFPTI
jgi:hypothetical protein